MAKAKAAASPKRSWFWLQGLLCGVVAATIPGTALLAAVLLGPSLAMLATEQVEGHPIARSMLLMGLAATVMPMRVLWDHGGSIDAALDVLGDPGRPLLAWGASGAGWLVGQVADLLTRFVMDAQAARAIQLLDQERAELTREWTPGSAA